MELVRKNIRMSPKVASWYEGRAKEMGVTQTNLMVMALQHYIDYQEAMKFSGNIQDLMSRFEKLKDYDQ